VHSSHPWAAPGPGPAGAPAETGAPWVVSRRSCEGGLAVVVDVQAGVTEAVGRSWPAGGLLLADDGVPAGTAIGALSPVGREALHQLVDRHGTPGLGPIVALPTGVEVRVEYLERSATGLVREAIARELRPALPR
jgi:hypothetical protein